MEFNKNNESFNFKLIKSYDITNIHNIVSNFETEWKLDVSRQNQKNGAHQNTNTYYIKSFDPKWQIGQPLKVFPLANNINVLKEVNIISKELEEFHGGICSLAMIVKLLPGSDIIPHQDDTPYLGIVRRHHIPIKTNKSVKFHVGNESINMMIGECWEINNSKTHYVINSSDEDRIHLIIDIVPNKFLNI